MKITVFTSNQSRHLSLISSLAEVADTVYAVQESATLFPGKIEDFYRNTPVMREYFSHVIEAETEVFGVPGFLPANVHQLSCKIGDASYLPEEILSDALDSDLYVVFGASYIKGWLCDFLVEKNAINIHMGTSPYYRGHSCNFWALYEGNPDYVGATVHYLSKGLDSGPMLFHAFPDASGNNAFELGMRAVKAAHKGICKHIAEGTLLDLPSVAQDKTKELKYSKGVDFTDAVAEEYLHNMPTTSFIQDKLDSRSYDHFLCPFVG